MTTISIHSVDLMFSVEKWGNNNTATKLRPFGTAQKMFGQHQCEWILRQADDGLDMFSNSVGT